MTRRAVFWSCLISLTLATLLARTALQCISPDYNVAHEANGLSGILRVANGRPLYPSLSNDPTAIHLYSPLHAWVVGRALRILSFTDLFPKVVFSRGMSLAVFGLLFALLWKVLKAKGHSPAIALLTLVLLSPKLLEYGAAARNDLWALLIEIAALFFFLDWLKKSRRQSFLLFLVIAPFGFWFRQMAVALSLSAFAWCIRHKKTRQAFAIFLAHLSLFLLFFSFSTPSQRLLYFTHAWLAPLGPLRPFSWQSLDLSLLSFLLAYSVYVISGITQLARKTASPETRFLKWAVAISFLIAMPSFLRQWSDVNYFFVPLTLLAPFVASTLQENEKNKTFERSLAIQLALVSGLYGFKSYRAWQNRSLEFEQVAIAAAQTTGPLVVTGHYSSSLLIRLGDRALWGPDVSDKIAADNPRLDELQKRIRSRLSHDPSLHILYTAPGAALETTILHPYFQNLTRMGCVNSWACWYSLVGTPPAAVLK